jgi:two-component system response regulator
MHEYEQVEILLAEDNPADAEMCMRALRKNHFGNHIHWVKDGAEALEFIHGTGAYAGRNPNQRPKLLLLDLKMPKVDGIEVLRQLKGNERTRTIPVVVMTSSNEESDVVESYRLGVNSYIVKPVDFSQFNETVSRTGFYWVLANRVPQTGAAETE